MLKRPTAKETEEDILQQQNEFLKIETKKEITAIAKADPLPAETFDVIGNVVERNCDGFQLPCVETVSDGFPTVFRVDASSKSVNHLKKKKSIFSLKLQGVENVSQMKVTEKTVEQTNHDIHEENVNIIKSMTADEIAAERTSLQQNLSPDLLEFLKKRGAKKSLLQCEKPAKNQSPDLNAVERNILKTVDKEFLEMDTIEPEKLEWIGDIPDATSLEPDGTYSARFNFAGDLQPFKTEIDVRSSLHHHGEEPDRPGYTIQELYQLSRSTVLQQRILALTTLSHIIRKTKMGYYDSCFDGVLLKKLVDSDLFFLLRFSMDDRTTTAAAVHCLHELFICRSDEVCLDRLLNFYTDNVEPFLYVSIETDKDTKEDELKDEEIISQDLVKGVLRTDLLIRFNYILTNFELDPITVSKIFEIMIRVCRHSRETCMEVFESDFVMYVVDYVNRNEAIHQAVKLLRVLGSSSHKVLCKMSEKIDFRFMLRIIDNDKPMFKLKLECLALWRLFLRHNLLTDLFQSFTPCFCRLLSFYVDKVDTVHGRFDFELFAGIVSILNAVLLAKNEIEVSYNSLIEICFEKWMSQLSFNERINYSVAKALGAIMNYFILKYDQTVIKSDLVFLNKLSPVLNNLTNFYGKICDNLINYSHIASYENFVRDPENLPSLCSVYHNGENYLKTVHDDSPWPFVQPFAEFLLKANGITNEFVEPLNRVKKSLEKFCNLILKHSENASWFSRYEVGVFVTLLKIKKKFNDDVLRYGFKMIPYFRIDDDRVLSALDLSQPFVSEVFQIHLSNTLTQFHNYFCENFPRHWMYEPISVATKETLKCLASILENCPELLGNVSPTLRFCHICLVLLDGENIFVPEIRKNLETCLQDVLENLNEIELTNVTISEKTFYELYRDLAIEYASCSYGDELFGKIVALPLYQKFDVSYRKLMWSELMHALRVITLPNNLKNYVNVDAFTSPVETDESLLVLYLNAVSNNVLTEKRNGFLRAVAIENVRKFINLPEKDESVAEFLKNNIRRVKSEELKKQLLGEETVPT